MKQVRLGDDKSLPIGNVGAITADMKAQQFILTPKIGFRVIDEEKIKVDASTGFRFWHAGQSLEFSPSALGLDLSGSNNWVDPLVGGHIHLALTPQLAIDMLGDVGRWGSRVPN